MTAAKRTLRIFFISVPPFPNMYLDALDVCQKLKDAGVGPLAQDSAYCDFAFYHTLVRYLGEAKIEELTMNGGLLAGGLFVSTGLSAQPASRPSTMTAAKRTLSKCALRPSKLIIASFFVLCNSPQ